jgi:lipooligosaccharide transport system ATP-binding protein
LEDTVIHVENLNKTYGDIKAVDSLCFQVKETECLGLLGPNGAGKSTSMKVIYGISIPDECQNTVISIFGFHPREDALRIKSLAGVVPQQDNLDSELNVKDNLAIYAKFYGMPALLARKRIDELLSFMELQDKAKARVQELSGGMQRRLTIARALINNPRLLILDEPTTGLDPQVRHLIWNKIRELQERGVTILLSTHYMEEAFQICNRIIIMDKGKKILEGPPRELLAGSIEKYVMEIHSAQRGTRDYQSYCTEYGLRYECFQDTVFIYSDKAEALSVLGEQLPVHDYHIRPANLEDLFLKVTGRSLNELQ